MLILLVVILVIFGGIIFWGISIRNNLVTMQQNYKNAFSQIDIQLKRRFDLIPNLVECVKAEMNFEKETLTKVVEARSGAVSALEKLKQDLGDEAAADAFIKANTNLNSAMRSFNIQVEQYPDLKASQNMLNLQEEISSTENKVAFSRQAYNDSVTDFNTYRRLFPNNIIAGACGFIKDATLLEFEDKEAIKEAPKVNF